MRRGHDFHKDKDEGEIVNLGQWEKNPCVTSLCFIPTTFIKKDCWWLRQLIVLGVGWQDCQSSPTRTLYPWFCCSSPHVDTSSSWRVAKHPGIAISRPPGSCSPSRTSHLSAHGFHAQEFSWFHPRYFSSVDLRMVWLRPLLTGWFVGSALWMFMHRLGNCKFVPSMVYVHFSPAASIV